MYDRISGNIWLDHLYVCQIQTSGTIFMDLFSHKSVGYLLFGRCWSGIGLMGGGGAASKL